MSVAKPTPHDAALMHVTGKARYVDDTPMPANTLHLAFGLSHVAHGTITSINLDAVKAADGVVKVLLAGDLPAENDVSPSAHDEPLLATGTVHYIGQPIFCVIATSHLAARKAARLGQIEIAEKAAILTIDDALAADSKFEKPLTFLKGEPEDILAQYGEDQTVTGVFELGG